MTLLVLPGPLAQQCEVPREISVRGTTIDALLRDVATRHPSLGRLLLDEAGELRRYYSIFLNDQDPRGLGGLAAPVEEDDVVTVLPPVAGGLARSGQAARPTAAPAWLAEVLWHAECAYPCEACGMVFSGPSGLRPMLARNAATNPAEHFLMDADDLVGGLICAKERGERLFAFYHSHPDGAAAPSPEDEAALWPGVGCLVVSVAKGRATGWRLVGAS
jgi:proteasome lid subunit RPN8/RPN11/molybdopterin converting factor small subunit